MSRKQATTWFADFETTQPTDEYGVEVYLWCILRNDIKYIGYDIESFLNQLKTMGKIIVYFHNLKFDFSYIQYYFLKNNIDYKLLEKKGTIYSVKFGEVELRDSMNFLPITLKEVGENYCSIHQKTSIDYNVYHGHKATQEEIDYVIEDCAVLEEGLTNYLNTLKEVLENAGSTYASSKVLKKLTNSGIAFESFKELSLFDECCPKTTQFEYDLFCGAYKGGFVYSNPRGIRTNVQMIDCNSMYPFCYSTKPLPYGKPITCFNLEDCERFKFFIMKINIKYELKDGYIPIIGGGVGKYGGVDYKASSNGEFEELTICNIDFNLIQRFYDIEFEFVWGFGFETKSEFYKKYCDTFLAVKNANKGIKRAVAKVMLNSPYGKTAMNGMNEIKKYYIDHKDNSVKSEVIGYEVDDNVYQYIPQAISITAYARELLLTTAEKIGFDSVHYMDTDSIKFDAKPVDFDFDDNVLGAWKDEGLCDLFKTISPKKYCYYTKGKLFYTCAGFSKKVLSDEMLHSKEVSEEEAIKLMNKFDKGLELSCLQSKKVKGGRALLPIKKEIK